MSAADLRNLAIARAAAERGLAACTRSWVLLMRLRALVAEQGLR